MFDKGILRSRGSRVVSAAGVGIALALLGCTVFAAQDKYSLRVPNGLAFSDFRGYENWQAVAVSQTDDLLKVMVAKSDTFKPDPTGAVNCGFACHTGVAAKDYIFTAYGKR